jgi:hypothetical protein
MIGCGAFALQQAFAAEGQWRAGIALTLILLMLAGAANLVINLRYNAWANGPLATMRSLSMAAALQDFSDPGDLILSDDQYVAALADRDVAPQFVDTSAKRIASGYLTAAELEGFVNSNNVRLILFASGRFDLIPGFRAWVAQRYHPVATFEDSGALFAQSE